MNHALGKAGRQTRCLGLACWKNAYQPREEHFDAKNGGSCDTERQFDAVADSLPKPKVIYVAQACSFPNLQLLLLRLSHNLTTDYHTPVTARHTMETPQSAPEQDPTNGLGAESPHLSLSWSTRLLSRFESDVDTKWADSILVGCFFVTGIVDSFAFNSYSCFVGMQTGMW